MNKKKATALLILLLLVLLLVITLGGAFFFIGRDKDKGSDNGGGDLPSINLPDQPVIEIPSLDNVSTLYNQEIDTLYYGGYNDLSDLSSYKTGDSSLKRMLINPYSDIVTYSGSATLGVGTKELNDTYSIYSVQLVATNFSRLSKNESTYYKDSTEMSATQEISADNLIIQRTYILDTTPYESNGVYDSDYSSDISAETWWHQTTKLMFDNIYADNIDFSNLTTNNDNVDNKDVSKHMNKYVKSYALGSSGKEGTIADSVRDFYYKVSTVDVDTGDDSTWIDPDGELATAFVTDYFDFESNNSWEDPEYTDKDDYYTSTSSIEEFTFPLLINGFAPVARDSKELNLDPSTDTTFMNILPFKYYGNRFVKLEDQTIHDGNREANVVVNGGFNDDYARRNYYGFTNEFGQLSYYKADKIIDQNDDVEPVKSDGRFGTPADVYGTATEDEPEGRDFDRGHVMADSLGGAPNAYNMTPQDAYLNEHSIEVGIEGRARNGNIKQYTSIPLYDSTTTQTPYAYFTSFVDDGRYVEWFFYNTSDGEPL